MPGSSSFILTYPTIVSAATTLTSCSVTYNNVLYVMQCFVLTGSRTIKMLSGGSGLTVPIPIGGTLTIKIGPITNP